MSTTAAEPLVSLVLPMYGVASTLDECLRSIEDQTHKNLEVICVNDGSPDESSAIAHAHASTDARIVVIDKANEGYGASCNRGLDLARGEWLAIVEPDDYLAPNAIEAMLAQAAALTSPIDVVKCAYWRVFEHEDGSADKVTCPYKGRVRPAGQPFSIGDGIELLLHHPAIWAALYRTEFLREKGIRFLEVPGAGWTDNPFMVETLCATDRIAYVDEPCYFYREHDFNDAEALAKRSPLVPLTRWNEMMDAAERLGVTDPRVASALAVRGVNYATITVSAAGMNDPEVKELLARSMGRLEPDVVLDNPILGPAGKKLFCEVRGIAAPTGPDFAHLGHLAKEMLYRVRSNGIGFAFKNAASRLNRVFSRGNKD